MQHRGYQQLKKITKQSDVYLQYTKKLTSILRMYHFAENNEQCRRSFEKYGLMELINKMVGFKQKMRNYPILGESIKNYCPA